MMNWLVRATTAHGHSHQRRGLLKKLAADESHAESNGAVDGTVRFDCEMFEYLTAGGSGALVRLAGRWRWAVEPSAQSLKLIVDAGSHAHMVSPLPELRAGPPPSDGSRRAAFSVPLELIESEECSFALSAGPGLVARLPRPRLSDESPVTKAPSVEDLRSQLETVLSEAALRSHELEDAERRLAESEALSQRRHESRATLEHQVAELAAAERNAADALERQENDLRTARADAAQRARELADAEKRLAVAESERSREAEARAALDTQVADLTAAARSAGDELAEHKTALEGAQAEAELRTRELNKAQEQLAEARAETVSEHAARAALEAQVADLTTAERSAREVLAEREIRLEAIRAEAELRTRELSKAQQDLEEARRQGESEREARSELELKLTVVAEAEQSARETLAERQAELDQARGHAKEQTHELAETRRQLAAAERGHVTERDARAALEDQVGELTEAGERAREALAQNETQLEAARKEARQRAAELKDTEGRLAQALENIEIVRVETAHKAHADLDRHLTELWRVRSDAQRQVIEARKQIKPRAQRRIDKAQQATADAKRDAKDARAARDKFEQLLVEATATEKSVRDALAQREAELERLRGEAADAERRIAAVRDVLR